MLDGNDPLVALAQIRGTPDGRTIVDMTRSRAGLALFGLLGLALFAAVAAVAIPAVVARTRDPYYAARPWYFWPFALFNRATHEPPLSFTDKTVPVDELLDELGRHWQSSAPASWRSRRRAPTRFGWRACGGGSRRGTRTTT